MRDAAEIEKIEQDLKTLLSKFYSQDHRHIQSLAALKSVSDKQSHEYSVSIGQLGWSGMGSLIDQVFCDVDTSNVDRGELLETEKLFRILMACLGSHALEIDENTPNNCAIRSMLSIWK